MDQRPECPATPPRRHVARFPSFGDESPQSVYSHRKNRSIDALPDLQSSPIRSPFLTPKSTRKSAKDHIKRLRNRNDACLSYLATPDTGSSRKTRYFTDQVQPSLKSKSLTDSLRSAAEENPFMDEPKSLMPPQIFLRTPSPHSLPVFEPISDSDDDIQVMNVADLKNIPRFHMESPFLELARPRKRKLDIDEIDFSTHMELVNSRTGERIIKKLTEEEMRFRPRRLEFTQVVTPSDRYSIANKFIEKNIGNKFTMDTGEPELGFSIFSDDE